MVDHDILIILKLLINVPFHITLQNVHHGKNTIIKDQIKTPSDTVKAVWINTRTSVMGLLMAWYTVYS